MNKYIKLIFVTFFSAPLFVIAQTIIFEHNFDGDSSEQLGGQDVDTKNGFWQNATERNTSSFRADGSVVNDPAGAHSGIWLPVFIEQGNIYTLSADIDTDSSVGTDWISLGYAQSHEDTSFGASNGYGSALVKSSRVEFFTGHNRDGKKDGLYVGTDAETKKLKVVLDATAKLSSSWTMEFFYGDESFESPANAASGDYANIKYVGFTKKKNASGTIDNFKFSKSTIPETSQFGLIAAVIAPLVVCSRRRYRETS